MTVQEQIMKIEEKQEEIVATNVSVEDYMEHYAEHFYEWVEGVVIKVVAASLYHNELIGYLYMLLLAYCSNTNSGRVILQPFVMKLKEVPNRRREPDLLVVLKTNPNQPQATVMEGPADICIEVVSESSIERDHGEKFVEYEKGGVPEYWIVDPLRNECRFYRLNENGRYIPQYEDADGNYRTSALPKLILHVPTLWQETLPDPLTVGLAVQKMLADS